MNYFKIDDYDIANGPGVRTTVWVTGCRLHCPGCHNPQSWDFYAGLPWNDSSREELRKALSKPEIQGITLTGGHPLEYENLSGVLNIIGIVRNEFPEKDIWLYTGYNLEIKDFDTTVYADKWDNDLLKRIILSRCDVVVDGPYIEEEKDITLAWRGSRNQRVIDVKKTIEKGEIVLFCE